MSAAEWVVVVVSVMSREPLLMSITFNTREEAEESARDLVPPFAFAAASIGNPYWK